MGGAPRLRCRDGAMDFPFAVCKNGTSLLCASFPLRFHVLQVLTHRWVVTEGSAKPMPTEATSARPRRSASWSYASWDFASALENAACFHCVWVDGLL